MRAVFAYVEVFSTGFYYEISHMKFTVDTWVRIMIIRVGILHIPQLDEAVSEVITEKLRDVIPMIFIILENSVDSQRNWIEHTLVRWSDEEELDLIITVGGTLPAPGPSSCEIVPEATLSVSERTLPGVPEAMRRYAQTETDLALLDRSIAGIRGRTFILNLPAGAAPALLFLESVAGLIEPIVAHLHSSPTAPQLSDVLEIAIDPKPNEKAASELVADTPSLPSKFDLQLDSEEFAAFLHRGEADV